ncbi:MAG: phytanoyl-CoA dioxygenase family protein [Myxococcales bacterium]|nr:MAG: phytanoyl-CoA dioxygenase family protein [Myxococcales bacterium]
MIGIYSLGKLLKNAFPPESGPVRRLFIRMLTQARAYRSQLHIQSLHPISEEVGNWAEQVKNKGFHVIEDYFTADECKQAIAELERLFSEYTELTVNRSDCRLFGVELASKICRRLADDPKLLSVAEVINGAKTVNFSTLGARLDFTPNNMGSGEGWHRDSFPPQVKAILFLTDVTIENGPFQLIRDSAGFKQLIADTWTARLGHYQHRFTDEQVQRLVKQSPERLMTFTARAGTLVLVNTGAIHRGSPIRSGTRYALTNYYMRKDQVTPETDKHFGKRLTKQFLESVT